MPTPQRIIRFLLASAMIAMCIAVQPAFAQWQVGLTAYGPALAQPPYFANPSVAPSGYDPFRYNLGTGRFNYVPIPYEYQRPGPTYNPSRFNWHAERFDYVPWGPPYNLADWARTFRGGGGSSDPYDYGGTASNFLDTRLYNRPTVTSSSRDPSAAAVSGAIDMTRAAVTRDPITAAQIDLPDPPPLPVISQMIQRHPDTFDATAARRKPTTAPAPAPAPSTEKTTAPAKAPTTATTTAPAPQTPRPITPHAAARHAVTSQAATTTQEGWTRVRGLVGRWEYDYANARWTFVLRGD